MFDQADLEDRMRTFRSAFESRYPNSGIIFASKAFQNKEMVRLLAREGLCLRVAADGTLVLLADSVSREGCTEDTVSASPLGGAGVRYHASGAQERQDAIQALGSRRTLPAASTVVTRASTVPR